MMQHASHPQPVVSYAPQPPAFPPRFPGGDIYTHLHWLQEQYELHYHHNAILLSSNVKLNNDNARLQQEQGQLKRQMAELRAEKEQQGRLSEEQNAKLLTENRLVTAEREALAAENRRLCAQQHTVDPEHQRTLIRKLKAKIVALKDELKAPREVDDGFSIGSVSCSNHCRRSHGVRQLVCSGCFMPAQDFMGRGRKGSKKIKCDWHHYLNSVSVSDSEDDGDGIDWHHYREDANTKINTRLDQGLFDWLQDYCLDNSDEIERQRIVERKENGPTVRRLVEDLRDIEDEIRKSHERLAVKKQKKRQIKRKLIVLTDEERAVTTDETILKGKLFTFCYIFSQPQQEFDRAWFPKLTGNKMLSERDAVKIFHQMLSAMRVIHREFVEAPKEQDKKFKPRKANPNQWRMLHGPGMHNEIEDTYVSTMEDARLGATALQNLIHMWNEGLI